MSIKKCHYCGHEGNDVNHVAHVHIGGQGIVQFPACDDVPACIRRVEHIPQPDPRTKRQLADLKAMREASRIRG